MTSPVLNFRRTIAREFHSRNGRDTRRKARRISAIGCSIRSRAGTDSGLGTTPFQGSALTAARCVNAPVGHETMHSPQATHDEAPIGASRSKAIRALYPLPIRPMTWLSRMSLQPRMQRSQRMQALWSTSMTSDESSCLRGSRREKRGGPISSRRASASSSQSCVFFSLAQGVGWSAMSSSVSMRTAERTRSRAARSGDSIVWTSIVSSTRWWQAGSSFRSRWTLPRFILEISTTHTRQTPTGAM